MKIDLPDEYIPLVINALEHYAAEVAVAEMRETAKRAGSRRRAH